jgi:diguanylate cyclase (GGDEF)-like protein
MDRTRDSLSLAMIDIDDFKAFNDAFGHLQGDRALRQVASTILSCCRKMDLVARLGGEEFAVIFPHTSAPEAAIIAERIRNAVETYDWSLRRVTVSIGIGTLDLSGLPRAELVDATDTALYEAKSRGKNRVCAASPRRADWNGPRPQPAARAQTKKAALSGSLL